MPMNPNFQFSVVIVSMAGDLALLNCLKSVEGLPVQCVIVASAPLKEPVNTYIKDHPVLVIVRPELSVPERRAVGLEASSCEWVAILEDTCEVGETWFNAAKKILGESGCAAASGPVQFSPSLSSGELALACTEYGRFTRARLFPTEDDDVTLEARSTDRTIGINLFYQKDVITGFIQSDGLIESELDAALILKGLRIIVDPNLVVRLSSVPQNSLTLGSRFNHGRLYGGLLRQRTSTSARISHLFRCVALPIVLSSRAILSLPAGHKSRFGAIIHILGFETAWSLGEFVGTLIGPGNARQSWR